MDGVIKSLDRLKILKFWEILKTHNHLLLDEGYSETKKYTEEQKAYIDSVWSDLYDDYFKLKKDARSQQFLNSKKDETMLVYKMELFVEMQSLMIKVENIRSMMHPEKYDDIKKGLYRSIQVIHEGLRVPLEMLDAIRFLDKVISSLANKYKITYKKNDNKVEQEVQNVYRVIADVGLTLGMQLNVNDMYVTEWIAYERTAIEISNDRKKQKHNGSR